MALTTEEVRTLHTHVYSTPSTILQEVERRKRDTALMKKIGALFKDNVPKCLGDSPALFFNRCLFTPNMEFRYFMDVATLFKLPVTLLRYPGVFVARNQEKYHLCKLHCYNTPGKKNGTNYNTHVIVDFNEEEGEKMLNVHTKWQEPLHAFHKRMLRNECPQADYKECDVSEWFDATKYATPHYYFFWFSLFIVHGVLCENYLVGDDEEDYFIKKHVLPSFLAVEQYFGVKPLVFPLLPLENEKGRRWLSYPQSVNTYFPKEVYYEQ